MTDSLKVVTQNLLNKDWSFSERMFAFFTEIKILNPDVILLQEYMASAHYSLSEQFNHVGYKQAAVAPDGYESYNMIWLRDSLPVLFQDTITYDVPHISIPSPVIRTAKAGREVWLASNHFIWGAENNQFRYKMAMQLSNYAKDNRKENQVFIAGGDFNAEPDEDSIRYLKGKHTQQGDRGTLWLDSFDAKADHVERHTQSPALSWVHKTADEHFGHLINGYALPSRRLDYLFSHGWQYGQHGQPLNYVLVKSSTSVDISDHYGVCVDFSL